MPRRDRCYSRYRLTWLLTACLTLIAACSSLGLEPAQSFDQKLAYAYGTHTGVLQATTRALNSQLLSSADAQEVLKLADQSRVLLDSAKALSGTDPQAAQAKLVLATAILTQLRAYFAERGVK